MYLYKYSNSKPGIKVLWEDLAESPQILVCYSTSKEESPYEFSVPGVQPLPRNLPCNIRKKLFFTHFQKFISRLLINQFQFSDQHFICFFLKFSLKIIRTPYYANVFFYLLLYRSTELSKAGCTQNYAKNRIWSEMRSAKGLSKTFNMPVAELHLVETFLTHVYLKIAIFPKIAFFRIFNLP